ncbi:MAG: hypothetical protein ABIR47_08115 [Candidatus Kapaibacterium sp.]
MTENMGDLEAELLITFSSAMREFQSEPWQSVEGGHPHLIVPEHSEHRK